MTNRLTVDDLPGMSDVEIIAHSAQLYADLEHETARAAGWKQSALTAEVDLARVTEQRDRIRESLQQLRMCPSANRCRTCAMVVREALGASATAASES